MGGTIQVTRGISLLTTRSFVWPGSHGRRQGEASWPMENYFQAEAFNLDKVLDEFEQNEGEAIKKNKNKESETRRWETMSHCEWQWDGLYLWWGNGTHE